MNVGGKSIGAFCAEMVTASSFSFPKNLRELHRKGKNGPHRFVVGAFLNEYGRRYGPENPVGRWSLNGVPSRILTVGYSKSDVYLDYVMKYNDLRDGAAEYLLTDLLE